jgi:hypothetical protein
VDVLEGVLADEGCRWHVQDPLAGVARVLVATPVVVDRQRVLYVVEQRGELRRLVHLSVTVDASPSIGNYVVLALWSDTAAAVPSVDGPGVWV